MALSEHSKPCNWKGYIVVSSSAEEKCAKCCCQKMHFLWIKVIEAPVYSFKNKKRFI
jgi:hypothetical protein